MPDFIKNETSSNYQELLTKFQISLCRNNILLTNYHCTQINHALQHIIFIYIAISS